jgi:membrane associated rhomboid family serine protease
MLIYWMVLQLFGGFTSIAAEAEGGVAFWAHVGGFIAGVVLVKLFTTRSHLAAHQAGHWRPSTRYLGR